MWVNSKVAAEILGVNNKSLIQAIYRAEKSAKKFCLIKCNILHFKRIDGRGGASGKILQIWLDDALCEKYYLNANFGTNGARCKNYNENLTNTNNKTKTNLTANLPEFSANLLTPKSAANENLDENGVGNDYLCANLSPSSSNFLAPQATDANFGGFNGMTGALDTNLNQGVKNENKNGSKRSSLCYQRKEHEDGQDLGQLICDERGNCECAKRGMGLRCRRCDRFVDVSIKNDTKARQAQKTGKNAINDGKNWGVNHGCADVSDAKPTQPTSANSSENYNENRDETSTNLSPFSSKFLSSHPTNVQIAHPTNTQTQDIKARIAYANTKKGAIALEKERILKAYERAKKSGVKSLNFIKNINANPTFFLKLSANKLFAWQRAYKESGFAGLIDERKSNRENIIDALGLSEIAQKFILSTDKKIDAPNLAMRLNEHLAVDMMDAKSILDLYRADGAIISEGAARRFIASWRKNSANAIKDAVRRYGVDKTRGLLMPGYGNASWCAKSINEIVEIDATKLDLICTDELMGELLNFDERAKKIQSRFSIISMIDVYSRVRVFEICDSENTLAVQKCIAKYILTYGKPRIIHGDNGKAFLSKALQSACENLGIEYKKSKPYSGWQKPHIERSFGVLQNRLSAAMANYIGNDVARRKSLEGLYGMGDRRAKKGEKTRLKNLMDISEFERVLDEYCFSVIPNLAINSGKEKIIPLQRFNAKKDEAVRIDEA